jgi:hypothetical protein
MNIYISTNLYPTHEFENVFTMLDRLGDNQGKGFDELHALN